ncbi:MAG TPA: hypothetical protein VLY04_11995 [Bryobacteraceae bacterium]|nr:hypothetical protein [Bryobacteraceae bacterium]
MWYSSRSLLLTLALFLTTAACAVRAPQTYRLIPQDRGRVLVPPGVATLAVTQATFTVEIPSWRPPCNPTGDAVAIQPSGKKLRITVTRDSLALQPPGWLGQWTAEAEAAGCLAPGKGLEFASRILDSVPLDPSVAYKLLHADNIRKGYIDLGPEDRLQVVSPIMKAGVAPDAPILETATASGNDRQITLDVRTTTNLIGVETAWYAFRPKPDHIGSTIVPIAAERSIQGRKEPADAPLTNYFQFSPSAAFYRLFYKTDPADNGITEIVITAPTRAELDRRTQALSADFNLCQKSDPDMCTVIPRRVAVNPFLLVTVNGAETRLVIGSSVRNAIMAGGGPPRGQEVLPQLTVFKPYAGKLVPVEFDRSRQEILDLVLLGGESISWK